MLPGRQPPQLPQGPTKRLASLPSRPAGWRAGGRQTWAFSTALQQAEIGAGLQPHFGVRSADFCILSCGGLPLAFCWPPPLTRCGPPRRRGAPAACRGANGNAECRGQHAFLYVTTREECVPAADGGPYVQQLLLFTLWSKSTLLDGATPILAGDATGGWESFLWIMCKEKGKKDKQAQADLKSSLIQHSRNTPLRAIPHQLGEAEGHQLWALVRLRPHQPAWLRGLCTATSTGLGVTHSPGPPTVTQHHERRTPWDRGSCCTYCIISSPEKN